MSGRWRTGMTLAGLAAALPAEAQTVHAACYVPTVGVVYRIKAPNTPAQCRSSTHVEFAWTELQDGSVVTARLADGAVTAAKLADAAVTSPRIAAGAVTRSRLAADVRTPLAYGLVNQDGTLGRSFNVAASAFRSSTNYYEITLQGITFDVARHVVQVTTVGPIPRFPVVSGIEGKLAVSMYTSGDATPAVGAFSFVIYDTP